MKKAGIFILMLLFILFAVSTFNEKERSAEDRAYATALVRHVVDGDTIILDDMTWVRYIGIDSPEIERAEISTPGECFGKEALERNRALVQGKTISLEKDRTDRDRYDRLLRYVWFDGVLINELLVKEGYARSTPIEPDTTYREQLFTAERHAREENLGLWKACQGS